MKITNKKVYFTIVCFAIAIITISATYAFFAGTTQSTNRTVQTGSTVFKISLAITPKYSDFSIIPMDDGDVFKALRNECKDKYNRGACSAYILRIYDYDEGQQYISGKMDITTENMENLSYMVLEETNEFNNETCITIDQKNYCTSVQTTPMGEGTDLSLGSAYNVEGLTEKNLLLVIWLTNLNESQNLTDIGSYNATITVSAGNGGEIKGTIANAVQLNPDPNPEPEEPEPDNNNP